VIRTEWILYDRTDDGLKTVPAESQKQAIKKAISLGIVPRRTEDGRPRRNGEQVELMKEDEFQSFMQMISE